MNRTLIPICFSSILVSIMLAACSQAADFSEDYLSDLPSNSSRVTMSRAENEAKPLQSEKQGQLGMLSDAEQKQPQFSPRPNASMLPRSVLPCLPESINEVSLAASTKYKGSTYYLIDLTIFRDERNTDVSFNRILVSQSGDQCKLLTPSGQYSLLITASFTSFVSEPIANQLALDRWKRHQNQLGSRQALQHEINEGTQPGAYMIELNPEDTWALRQLGITIPEEALERLREREAEDTSSNLSR